MHFRKARAERPQPVSAHDDAFVVEFIAAHFTVEQLTVAGVLNRPVDSTLRRWIVSQKYVGLEFMAHYYLGHHFKLPFSPLHLALLQIIDDDLMCTTGTGTRTAVAFPRGYGKTTVVNLLTPLYAITQATTLQIHYILMLAQSSDQAKEYMATLRFELESNGRLASDFPECTGRGGVWRDDKIITANRVKIEPLGRGQKVRGRKFGQYRPGLIIMDDLEEIADAESEAQRKKTEAWLLGSVMLTGDRSVDEPLLNARVFLVGTVVHYLAVFATMLQNPMWKSFRFGAVKSFSKRPDLWDLWRTKLTDLTKTKETREAEAAAFYNTYEAEMSEGTEVWWPQKDTYYSLMVLWAILGPLAFYREIQNEPDDPSVRVFTQFRTYEIAVDLKVGTSAFVLPETGSTIPMVECVLLGATDPSLGGKTSSDPSSNVLGWLHPPTGYVFLLEADEEIRTPGHWLTDVSALLASYNVEAWAIEAFVFQSIMVGLAQESTDAPVLFEPLTASASKASRIKTLQPPVHNGHIRWPSDPTPGLVRLQEQLSAWPHSADHMADALEMLWRYSRGRRVVRSAVVLQGSAFRFGQHADPMKASYYDVDVTTAERKEKLTQHQGEFTFMGRVVPTLSPLPPVHPAGRDPGVLWLPRIVQ